ncbi:MAG: EpsG family protein [Selenomonadaceae bacterium]|nr:EpsG family protein [Selenomonadaceae bacterium]
MGVFDLTIYFYVLTVPVLCAVLLKYRLTWNGRLLCGGGKLYLLVVCFLLGIIMCFRSVSVGTDTGGYAINVYQDIIARYSFDDMLDDTREVVKAPLYWWMFWLVSYVSADPQMYILVESLIIITGMGYFIYKSGVNIPLAVLTFILTLQYFLSFNIARQFVGIVLGINAFLLLYKSFKNIWGWLLLLLAIGIHVVCASFIIPIFFMYLSQHLNYRKLLLSIFTLALAIGPFSYAIIELILVDMLGGDTIYIGYIEGNGDVIRGQANASGMAVFGQALGYLSMGLLYVYAINRYKLPYKGTLTYSILPSTIFFAVLWLVFYDTVLIDRFLMGFRALQIAFIPSVIFLFPRTERWVLIGVMCVALTIYSLRMLALGQMSIFPYSFGF